MAERRSPSPGSASPKVSKEAWRENIKEDQGDQDEDDEKLSSHTSDEDESDNYESGDDEIDGGGGQQITREMLDLRLTAGAQQPEEPLDPVRQCSTQCCMICLYKSFLF